MRRAVLFFVHSELSVQYMPFAAGLRKQDIDAVAIVQGELDRRTTEQTGVYTKVIDILQDFNPRRASAEYKEHLGELAVLEARFDPPGRIICDAMMDRWVRQRRLSREWIVGYVSYCLGRLRALYSEFQPMACVGETTTLLYRLAYRVAMPATPYLFPSALRYFDRVYFERDLDFLWPECRKKYRAFIADGVPDHLREPAAAAYERIVHLSEKPYYARASGGWRRGPEPITKKLELSRAQTNLDYWRFEILHDGYRSPRTVPFQQYFPHEKLSRLVKGVLRKAAFDRRASKDLPDTPFVTYFLHFQPEYTMDSQGFRFLDQTELVRNIAAALPIDVPLVVKEQPFMVGVRPASYYDKLLTIPNVRLVTDTVDSHVLIQKSKIIFSIVGTAAMEAICYGTPAILFGPISFNEFRGAELVEDLNELPARIDYRLRHGSDATPEDAIAMLAAEYACSYPGKFRGVSVDPTALLQDNQEELGLALLNELEHLGAVKVPIASKRM